MARRPDGSYEFGDYNSQNPDFQTRHLVEQQRRAEQERADETQRRNAESEASRFTQRGGAFSQVSSSPDSGLLTPQHRSRNIIIIVSIIGFVVIRFMIHLYLSAG